MKDLVRDYLDARISRRALTRGLAAAGLTASVAKSYAQALSPPAAPQTPPPSTPHLPDETRPGATAAAPGVRQMKGTGGALFTQQLKAAGVEYIFFNPSTADAPIYDSLVDEPGIQLIKGVQEGAVVAMADGYARATGKLGVALVANVGLPNALTQMVNSWKDQIPILLGAASLSQEANGREAFQDYERLDTMPGPISKWTWLAATVEGVPETTRRAIKYATTAPAGPVYLSFPENILRLEATSQIFDESLFNVPMRIRPDAQDVERAARMLIEAKAPILSFGDEVTLCGAEKELVALAELLGLPAADGGAGALGFWSRPFPTRHPLYIGPFVRELRFPQNADVHLNIGWKHGEVQMPGAKQISIRRDPASIARNAPVDLPIVADIKLATRDLIDAVNSLATKDRLKQIADERSARARAYTDDRAKLIQSIAADRAGGPSITMERLGVELERWMDKNAIYVNDVDSGKRMDPFMAFGGDDKTYIATGPNILGWGMAAGLGVKLAHPDRQVVSVVGDGSFLFSGPQPLWSLSRYQAPTTSIVLNNRSYNNERNRIWMSGGAQYREGRDMTCYLGAPDVDYAMLAKAFGVEGEAVKDAGDIGAALARAKRANMDGRPYLLDVAVERDGVGSASAWHPAFSIADQRTRKV